MYGGSPVANPEGVHEVEDPFSRQQPSNHACTPRKVGKPEPEDNQRKARAREEQEQNPDQDQQKSYGISKCARVGSLRRCSGAEEVMGKIEEQAANQKIGSQTEHGRDCEPGKR